MNPFYASLSLLTHPHPLSPYTNIPNIITPPRPILPRILHHLCCRILHHPPLLAYTTLHPMVPIVLPAKCMKTCEQVGERLALKEGQVYGDVGFAKGGKCIVETYIHVPGVCVGGGGGSGLRGECAWGWLGEREYVGMGVYLLPIQHNHASHPHITPTHPPTHITPTQPHHPHQPPSRTVDVRCKTQPPPTQWVFCFHSL